MQAGEVAQLRRYLPAQLVPAEGQPCQVGEVAQLRRYLPAQLVPAEGQPCQVGEVAQLRRYLPAQLVPAEGQPCQVGEIAQFRRYLPAQLVPVEPQYGDAAVVVSGDAWPLANRHVAQPVIVSYPIRAAGGVIEGDQRFPVRFGRGLHQRGSGGSPGRGRRFGDFRCGPGGGPSRGSPTRQLTGAAAGQQQQRQTQCQGKDSQEKSWRSHLDSLPVFAGPRCDGMVRPDNSTRRGIACLRTRRGGVNDPAGLIAWRPVGIRRAGGWLCPVAAPMTKNTRPGVRA